jgi:hypothetical protein
MQIIWSSLAYIFSPWPPLDPGNIVGKLSSTIFPLFVGKLSTTIFPLFVGKLSTTIFPLFPQRL